MKFLCRYLDEKEPTLENFAKVVRSLEGGRREGGREWARLARARVRRIAAPGKPPTREAIADPYFVAFALVSASQIALP
jgi:hypothetical protein